MLVPYAVSEDLAVLLREGPNFENTRRLFLGRCSHLGEGHVQFHRKILRPNGKKLDEFESSICQAFLELERQLALRAWLKELNITAAKEAEDWRWLEDYHLCSHSSTEIFSRKSKSS